MTNAWLTFLVLSFGVSFAIRLALDEETITADWNDMQRNVYESGKPNVVLPHFCFSNSTARDAFLHLNPFPEHVQWTPQRQFVSFQCAWNTGPNEDSLDAFSSLGLRNARAVERFRTRVSRMCTVASRAPFAQTVQFTTLNNVLRVIVNVTGPIKVIPDVPSIQ
jgi:hypothetical protein